jgi:ribonuclease BN (tRNA processing enzyme)
MRLTVVGCSGSLPGPGSPASCYLVEHDGFRVVVDLGSGAIGPLQRHVGLDAVDAVLISHLHVDHVVDLCSYYVARRYAPGGPLPPLQVVAPAGTREQLASAYGTSPECLDLVFSFETHAWTADLGPFRLTTARVAHPVEAYGLRLDADGGSITYSGDTGPCDSLVDLARGTDLLLAEASFVDGEENPPEVHLTGSQAGAAAAAAGAGQLVVTHVPPWHQVQRALDEAATTFSGPVTAAAADQVITP